MREQRMGADQSLLRILGVEFVGCFTSFFSNGIKSGRRKSLQRIGRLGMNHAQTKIGVIAHEQDQYCCQHNLNNAPDNEMDPGHNYAL